MQQIADWLRKLGLGQYAQRFAENDIELMRRRREMQWAARINAALLHASREGATSAHLYDVAAKAYAAVGEAEEITKHHQGGPCGYVERDWVATPKGTERVQAVQGFAWNPSIKGAKAEDTALLRDGEIEIVTATRDLPVTEAEVGGKVYRSAGVYLA